MFFEKEDLFRNCAIMKISVNLNISAADDTSNSQSVFTIPEKAPTLGNCTTQIKC